MKTPLMLAGLALYSLASIGCEEKSPIEEAAEDAGDAMEDVADDVEDATD